jgi:hypothetical protein
MNRKLLQVYVSPRMEAFFHCLVLCAITFSVYFKSLGNSFVYDDNSKVVANAVYRNFDLQRIFFGLGNGLEWLPLRDLTYAIDFALWGENPIGFHVSNLVIYSINIVAVYLFTGLLVRMFNNEPEPSVETRYIPFFTALLFAVHPIHSEAVSMIFTRNVLVSGLFFFLTCYVFLYVDRKNVRPGAPCSVAILGLYVCSVLSKVTTIILPLTLPLLLLTPPVKQRFHKWKNVIILLSFFMICFYVFFKEVAKRTRILNADVSTLSDLAERLCVAIQIPVFYLGKLLFPSNLTIEYDIAFASGLLDWKTCSSLVILISLFVAAIVLRRSLPQLFFGLFWYLVTMVPVLNLFGTVPIVADRYLYLPSYGLLFFIVVIFFKTGRWQTQRRFVLISMTILLACITVRQNEFYRNDVVLWEHALATSPQSIKAQKNLGWSYYHAGSHEKALEAFTMLKEVRPNDFSYELALGLRQVEQKNWSAAIPPLLIALEKKEDSLYVLYLLGTAYRNLGEYSKALFCFERILVSKESDFSGYHETARNNIGYLESLLQKTK